MAETPRLRLLSLFDRCGVVEKADDRTLDGGLGARQIEKLGLRTRGMHCMLDNYNAEPLEDDAVSHGNRKKAKMRAQEALTLSVSLTSHLWLTSRRASCRRPWCEGLLL